MKKPIKKLISIMLSLMLVFSSTLVVFAEDTEKLKEVTTEAAEQVEEIVEEEKEELPEEIIEAPEEESKQDEELPEGETKEELPEEGTEEVSAEEDEEEIDSEDAVENIIEENVSDFSADYYWNLYYESWGQNMDISDDVVQNGIDILFYYNAQKDEWNKDNIVAYYSGIDNYGKDYTLTFYDDICLEFIKFGTYDYPISPPYDDIVLTIDLNGHDVHVGQQKYKNDPDWDSMSIYCNYNLQIVDNSKYHNGTLYNRFGDDYYAYSIFVNEELTIKDATLKLYDTFTNDAYGNIIAGDLRLLSGSIDIDYVTDLYSSNVKAGIYVANDVMIVDGAIKCTYTVSTAAIYAGGSYTQIGGRVDLFLDSNATDINPKRLFVMGIAVGDVFGYYLTGSPSNHPNNEFYMNGGSLFICMGKNIAKLEMRNYGIATTGDIEFARNAHVNINSLGTDIVRNDNGGSSKQGIYCINSYYGDIKLDGFANVECSVGNTYNIGQVACLAATEGDINIIGKVSLSSTIGNVMSAGQICNIYAQHELTITDNSVVNTKIGYVENVENVLNLCASMEEYVVDDLTIDGQAKVNASIGNINRNGGNSYFGGNVYSHYGNVIIANNSTVNATTANIYNIECFYNIGSNGYEPKTDVYIVSEDVPHSSFSSYISEERRPLSGKPTVNAYINSATNALDLYNIYSESDIVVIGADVNAKIGDLTDTSGANFVIWGSNDEGIYIANDSRVTASIGDIYVKKYENKKRGACGFYAPGANVYFINNSAISINIGDYILNEAKVNNPRLNGYYGIFAYDVEVKRGASLDVNGGYGGSLIFGSHIIFGDGTNTYLNANSSISNGELKVPVETALITIQYDNGNNVGVGIEGGNLYGYNMVQDNGYGVNYDGPTDVEQCFFVVGEDSEVVLDVLSYGGEVVPRLTKNADGGSHLFSSNVIPVIDSTYCYGSPSITGLYGTYSNDPELLKTSRYVMFSYRPYIIPDFDDDSGESSSDTKHVVPNTGVYY